SCGKPRAPVLQSHAIALQPASRSSPESFFSVMNDADSSQSQPDAQDAASVPAILPAMLDLVATKWEREAKDILKRPPPATAPKVTSRRIGIHTSTSGGVETAAERAYRLGCNTFQIFSSSPRMWKPYELARAQCDEMMRLKEKYGIA